MDVSQVVGFCSGDAETGEVLVLAVLPEHEGQGVGRRLLGRWWASTGALGHRRVWLAASPDPAIRAHGFYRARGMEAERRGVDAIGDEILVRDI